MTESDALMNLVSVIIPTYNRVDTICRAVDSVLAQTVRPMEVIVVDDGSTDNTASVLSRYGDSIVVIRQDNAGVSAARNAGIKAARGDLIALLDSDDAWHPDKQEKQLKLMELCPDVGVVGAGVRVVSCDDGNVLMIGSKERRGPILDELLFDDFLTTSTLLIRKRCLDELGGRLFCEEFSWAEDWEMKIRLASRYEVYVTSEVLVDYYVTSGSLSQSGSAELLEATVRRLYSVIIDDRFVRPAFEQRRRNIESNIHFLVGRELYRGGRVWEARKRLLKFLIESPFTPNLRSSLVMLLFSPGVRRWYRRMKACMKCR